MEPPDVIKHFGSVAKTAAALKTTRQTVNYWRKVGRIPFARQFDIEQLTRGKLKAVR